MINRKVLEEQVNKKLSESALADEKINSKFEGRLHVLLFDFMMKKRDLNLVSVKSTYYLAMVEARYGLISAIPRVESDKLKVEVDMISMERLQEITTEMLDQFQHTYKQPNYSQMGLMKNAYKYNDDFQLSVKLT